MFHPHSTNRAGLATAPCLLILLSLLAAPVSAQTQLPPVVATRTAAPAAHELTDSERAKRDADKVSQFIRFLADKSAKPAAPAPVAAPAAAPAPAAKRVAAKTEPSAVAPKKGPDTPITETVAALPVPEQAPAAAAAPVVASPDPGIRVAMATMAAPPPAPAPAAIIEEPEPLKPVFQVQPEFPRQLLNTLQSGTVAVRFVVKPDGSVGQVEALSSTHKRLVQAALTAVSQWRFAPIKQERVANVEVGFRMD